jgi:large subunit ribosomal protein L4e
MNVKIKTISGSDSNSIKLPVQFTENFRPDLIKKAVLRIRANKRQPYGAHPEAGKRSSAEVSRRRHNYRGSYGIGISRVPRKVMSRRGTRMNWVGAFAPGTVGGRRAHPPKAEKVWSQKMNVKERRKAIRSALAATVNKELVAARGHKLPVSYPLVIEAKAEQIVKTKDAIKMLMDLGLAEELKRCQHKIIRAGIGKMRGRKYQKKKGPLVVISENAPVYKALRNVPGVDVVVVNNVNAELLAPGTDAGRITIYTEGAIKKIDEGKLFTN